MHSRKTGNVRIRSIAPDKGKKSALVLMSRMPLLTVACNACLTVPKINETNRTKRVWSDWLTSSEVLSKVQTRQGTRLHPDFARRPISHASARFRAVRFRLLPANFACCPSFRSFSVPVSYFERLCPISNAFARFWTPPADFVLLWKLSSDFGLWGPFLRLSVLVTAA